MRAPINFLMLTLSLILSCENKDLDCKDCASALAGTAAIKSSFSNKHFKLLFNSKVEPQLYLFDTVKNDVSIGYGFCKFESNDEFFRTDIIKASGHVYWACNKVDSFLLIKNYKQTDICASPIHIIKQQFDLFNQYWYLDTLRVSDAAYLPPCGYSPGFQFSTDGTCKIEMVVNETIADYSLLGTDSIHFTRKATSLAIPTTPYQINFEINYWKALDGSDSFKVKYQIENNELTLFTKSGSLKFYCKQ